MKFNKAQQRTNESLDYIHVDLWGPKRNPSHSGARYFLSIVDYYLRKIYIFIQKTKDKTFGNFKSWKTLVEIHTRMKFKRLTIDNGLEFRNDAFNNYYVVYGIPRHKTIVGTPEQNGMAERFNQTILERVRCMLFSALLKKVFWIEVVVKTPEEVL